MVPRRHAPRLQSEICLRGLIVPQQAREAERQPGGRVWLNQYENSRQLHIIEKWFPGERLTGGLVKMSILQKLTDTSEVFTKE